VIVQNTGFTFSPSLWPSDHLVSGALLGQSPNESFPLLHHANAGSPCVIPIAFVRRVSFALNSPVDFTLQGGEEFTSTFH
jgi:hypothetical protein